VTTETLGLEEARALLRVSRDCLLRRARAGKVPGAKIGRQWVFIRADLVELIRKQASERACHSIAAATLRTGGVGSRSINGKSASPLERELEAKLRSLKPRLALVRGGKRS